ncbi:MAG: chaperone modulatory protein CbpM [Gammaproteobacteria bacterium]|jgi:chaperone modulatory protein CbpM
MNDDHPTSAGALLDETAEFTVQDFCQVCGVHSKLIIEVVEEGVITPQGAVPTRWWFSAKALGRAQVALRLTRDLQINWAGAALALELLDEFASYRQHHQRDRWFR